MWYGLSRFEAAAAPHLEPDEHVVGGTWGRTPEGALGGATLPKVFEIAVTDRRLLFFDRSPLTGRPNDLVAAVPLTDVAVAEPTDRRHGIESASVRLRTGGSIDFEVAKLGARALVEQFVACVNDRLAAAPAASPGGHQRSTS